MYVIDLFCGGGGFSAGAHEADATVVLAVDNNPKALAQHYHNWPKCKHVLMELGGDVDAFVDDLRVFMASLDGPCHVHGSPPCQGFTSLNTKYNNVVGPDRHALGHEGDLNYTKTCLTYWYLEVIRRLAPTSWSMENVPYARKFLEFRTPWIYTTPGVHIYPNVFGYECGAPTMRKRLIVTTADLSDRKSSDKPSNTRRLQNPAVNFLPHLEDEFQLDRRRIAISTQTWNWSAHAYGGLVARPINFSQGEGLRPITWNSYAVVARPGPVNLWIKRELGRPWTLARCITLQERLKIMGFPDTYRLSSGRTMVCEFYDDLKVGSKRANSVEVKGLGKCSHERIIGNAVCPGLAKMIIERITISDAIGE